MRMIDIEPFEKEGWHLQRYVAGMYGAAIEFKDTSEIPTVDVVPLEPLCKWLAKWATWYVIDNYDNSDGWKAILTKWMEEQDAKEKG